jgi:hypothetical protein
VIPSHRVQLAEVCNGLGLDTAAFIGVNKAEFEAEFLEHWDGCKAYLIDPYIPCLEFEWDRGTDAAQARKATAPFGNRAVFIEMTSLEAAPLVSDSLGFVYIDGLHDYEHVAVDIAAWWPKVRSGGILAGHDYIWCMPGVVRAVNEFIAREGLPLNLTAEEYRYLTWWVQKP